MDNEEETDKTDTIREEQERTTRKKADFLAALGENMGIITMACVRCGIHRSTYYDWLQRDRDFAESIKKILRLQVGEVEDRLLKAIARDRIAAIIFYLKNKHPDYKPKLEVSGDVAINKYAKLTDEQLARELAELEAREAENAGGENTQD